MKTTIKSIILGTVLLGTLVITGYDGKVANEDIGKLVTADMKKSVENTKRELEEYKRLLEIGHNISGFYDKKTEDQIKSLENKLKTQLDLLQIQQNKNYGKHQSHFDKIRQNLKKNENELDSLDEKIKKVQDFKNDFGRLPGERAAGERELNGLYSERADLFERISNQRSSLIYLQRKIIKGN